MEAFIERLLAAYESGKMTRRALIRSLAATTGAGAYLAFAELPFEGVSINHVTFFVSDAPRSTAFYQKLLGLPVRQQKPTGTILGLGKSFLVARQDQSGKLGVDHFSIGIKDFNVERVAARLRQQGLSPEVIRGNELYFRDADDMKVQLSAEDYAGQLP